MSSKSSTPQHAVRANAYPTEGFSLVVDGKLKTHFATSEAALKAAQELKERYPALQIMVRDGATAISTAV